MNEEGDDLVKWRGIITNIFCVDCVCWFFVVAVVVCELLYSKIMGMFMLVCCNVTDAVHVSRSLNHFILGKGAEQKSVYE